MTRTRDLADFAASDNIVETTTTVTANHRDLIFADSTSGGFDIITPLNPINGTRFEVYPTGLLVNLVANPSGTSTTIQGETSVLIDQTDVSLSLKCLNNVWQIERRSIING
jgi:hypothetical protein